jgi:hypothetical protein
MTKVSRYSANGTTQRSGTAAMRMVRKVVRPSSRDEGTNDSATQRNRWGQVMTCSDTSSAQVAAQPPADSPCQSEPRSS